MDMAVRGRLFLFPHYYVYIDGFNFYYGLRRTKRIEPQWADYYWIDMVKLCEGSVLSNRISRSFDEKEPFFQIE